MSLEVWIAIAGILTPVFVGVIILIYRVGGLDQRIKSMIPLVSKIIEIDVKVRELWWRARNTINKSPMVLNAQGKQILKETNIQSFTDKYFDEIVSSVHDLKPQNAWDAQECLIETLYTYKDMVKNEMDISSFSSDINTILFVAAINIRDEVIKKLNFRREDIDKFDPNKP